MPFNPDNVFDIPDLDTPIYRIIPLARFEQLMATRELVLVKPSKWPDQYESFLLKARAVIGKLKNVGLQPLLDKVYGQCWMLCPDSEGMWKLYSSPQRLPAKWFHRQVFLYNRWLNGDPYQHEGVKLRTTPRILLEAFHDDASPFADLCYFMGKVHYWSVTQIDDFMADPDAVEGQLLDPNGRGHARMLMVKRDFFEHEQEVRLVFIANRDDFDETTNPVYKFQVDPNVTFDEVALDFRLTPAEFADTSTRIRNAGFNGTINQSAVGAAPAHVVQVNV